MYVDSAFQNLGKTADTRTSYLLKSKTVKGDPVIKVDSDKDYKVDDDAPALVVRKQGDDGQFSWKPVTDTKEFKELFNKASIEDKREHFGLWTDARKWVIMPKDGIPQDKEVQTLGQHWDEHQFHSADKVYSKEYRQPMAWIDNYTQVVDSGVKLSERESVTGNLTILEEPQKITKSEAQITTLWGLYGDGWRPAQTSTLVNTCPK